MGRHRVARPVALVANNFPPVHGGSAVVYANLARYAAGRLIVLAARESYVDGLPVIGWREHDRAQPYRVVRLKLLRARMPAQTPTGLRKLAMRLQEAAIRLGIVAALARLVLSQGVRTICVGELHASSWIVRLAAALPGLRTIIYVHGEEITTNDRYDAGHVRARRTLLAGGHVVVVSRFTRAIVTHLLGPDAAHRVTLIENGVDGARFTPGCKATHLLDLYGLHDRFVYISVCRLLEKKGVDHAIRAFARVHQAAPRTSYLVVGAGPFHADLVALAARLGVSQAVVFAGQVAADELAEHYRLGDVFVMPNRELPDGDTEGFGLVFLEANSCGLPVIAGRDGGSTDAVQHGVNGLVVDGHAVDAIAEAMLRLHHDAALRTRLARQGLQAAGAAGWASKARAFLDLCA